MQTMMRKAAAGRNVAARSLAGRKSASGSAGKVLTGRECEFWGGGAWIRDRGFVVFWGGIARVLKSKTSALARALPMHDR